VSFKKTVLLALGTIACGVSIYYFEFIQKEKKQINKEASLFIMKNKVEDINILEIQTKALKIILQRNNNIWQITDPLQDQADAGVVSELIKNLSEEKMQNIESLSSLNLSEFGLTEPAATYVWITNLGRSEKIRISAEKNFEGLSFAQINDEPTARIVQPIWLSQSQKNLTFFREKRLYRNSLADILNIKIKSLNEEFVLEKKDQLWVAPQFLNYDLDQNKVRKMIKNFSETTVQDYIFEGDPSVKELKLKGLLKAGVRIHFQSLSDEWNVSINLSHQDQTLYALTSKPTYLVKLDISQWEKFANINLDSLRDRKKWITFAITDVEKVFLKTNNKDIEFFNENQSWNLKSKLPENTDFLPVKAEKILDLVHDLEVSEFVAADIAKKFVGHNMVILKAANDKLVFQLNWGPLVKMKFNGLQKEVYLARTQLSKNIFAIDKSKIDEINIQSVFQKKESKSIEVHK